MTKLDKILGVVMFITALLILGMMIVGVVRGNVSPVEFEIITSEPYIPLVQHPQPESTERVTATVRQTFYSLQEGESQVGYASLTYQDKPITLKDNIFYYNDDEFGELPIIVVNIDEVVDSGLNEYGTYNKFGSVYCLEYPTGEVTHAIVLDSCGACSRDPRVDLWVKNDDYRYDVPGVKMTLVRYGFSGESSKTTK